MEASLRRRGPLLPLESQLRKCGKVLISARVYSPIVKNEAMAAAAPAAPDVLRDVQSGLERLSLCLDRCGEALVMAPSGAAGATHSWEEAKSR